MPTFDLRCEACGRVKEVFRVAEPTPLACDCGGIMEHVYTLASQHSTGFKPFWHPHLGHTPVMVESWKHYRQLLRERNASNELAS